MRVKEYLSVREIEFESINVLESEEGLAQLRALGARSVPVVSRGDKYVFAQILGDVVEFLGLDDDTGPQLSPEQLVERYDHVLDTAIRLVRQMPDDQLENMLPGRPRSWRVLLHHVFQIPTAYLEMEDTGRTLAYENLVAPPPESMTSSEDIARFGEALRTRFNAWAEGADALDFDAKVPTYFGDMRRHEMFERTVWHSTQHVRQVASLLESIGIEPDRPLTKADIEGLPLTDKVWG